MRLEVLGSIGLRGFRFSEFRVQGSGYPVYGAGGGEGVNPVHFVWPHASTASITILL